MSHFQNNIIVDELKIKPLTPDMKNNLQEKRVIFSSLSLVSTKQI